MARTKSSKKTVLTTLEDHIANSTAVVFASIKGLKVSESEVLRRQARAEKLGLQMAKKTLLRTAFAQKGFDDVDFKSMDGEIVATFSYGDEVAPARVLSKFAKDHENLRILGGLMVSAPIGSRVMDAAAVKRLSSLPTRDELLAKLVGSLASPMSGMVSVLQGNLSGFVRVLNAYAQSKS
ncbi:MAG: 50S ribosomal protein L10 [bacterium]|nr:50S ribosomal protein L10 [bacterium]